jgi:hypothetical protein
MADNNHLVGTLSTNLGALSSLSEFVIGKLELEGRPSCRMSTIHRLKSNDGCSKFQLQTT